MTPTPTPTWGTPQPPADQPVPPRRRAWLPIAIAALAVLLVAAAVGVVVHRNNPPPPSSAQAAPTPAASTIEPTQAPDFVPPSALLSPSPGASEPDIIITMGPDQTVPTQAPDTSLPSAPAGSQQTPRPSDSSSPPTNDPAAATKAYYGALAARHSSAAFSMLCQETQSAYGEDNYVKSYAADVASGTGIKKWTVGMPVQVSGTEAAVPGTLVLDDGESVPITVLLLQETGAWHVCSSDLGGVLPNPGSGSGTGTVTT